MEMEGLEVHRVESEPFQLKLLGKHEEYIYSMGCDTIAKNKIYIRDGRSTEIGGKRIH